MTKKQPASFSLVTEWENAFLAEDDRTLRMLSALRAQLRLLLSVKNGELNHPASGFLSRFSFPVPLILGYFEEWDGAAIQRQILGAFGEDAHLIDLQLIPSHEKKYYIIKTMSALTAKTDLVVFIDCDVLPEDDWLLELLSTLHDSPYQVAFGHTVIDHDSLYSKSFSLIKFQRPMPEPKIVPTQFGYANNLVIYRGVLQEIHWPSSEDTYKIANLEWVRMLRDANVTMAHNQKAIVRHPPPLPRNYLWRAFFHGRDEMIDRINAKVGQPAKSAQLENLESPGVGPWATALRRITSPFRNYRRVNLPLWQVPFAFILVCLYYVGFTAGYLIHKLFPAYSIANLDYIIMAED
jgi:hypothetical protein